MTDTAFALAPAEEYAKARQHFLELNGSTAAMNAYLRIALLALSAVCLGLVMLSARIYQSSRDVKPLVIRIDEVGRATASSYENLRYEPREAELKYFLIQFVQQHYGRMRATLRDNFSRSLYFLDSRLADDIMSTSRANKMIETFLMENGEEVDIAIQNVAIEDLRKSPFRATVDYERIYYAPITHQELRREQYVGNFVFSIRSQVPNALIPINPLGLTITYFREDQAFR